MFAEFAMVEALESRQFLSAAPAGGELTANPPPQEVGLLLPAIQPSHEASRPACHSPPPPANTALASNSPSPGSEMACQNNLKQIALAAH